MLQHFIVAVVVIVLLAAVRTVLSIKAAGSSAKYKTGSSAGCMQQHCGACDKAGTGAREAKKH